MSEAEWAVTESTLPGPAWKLGKGGRPAQHCRRDIVDAIRYLVKEGIQWRAMPADFPPWPSVYDYLAGPCSSTGVAHAASLAFYRLFSI
jgi:transposase